MRPQNVRCLFANLLWNKATLVTHIYLLVSVDNVESHSCGIFVFGFWKNTF